MKNNFKLSNVLEQVINSKNYVHNVKHMIEKYICPIEFSLKMQGIDAKLSVFRVVQSKTGNDIRENHVIGSQWFGVNFLEDCKLEQNNFIAMQLTELSLQKSDVCDCQVSLSRMSHVTLEESCFLKNKISLTTFSDVNITESDFTENTLSRVEFVGSIINASRLSQLNMMNTTFKDCEFDACNIQGIQFVDCDFKDCSFSKIMALPSTSVKISGRRMHGKQFANANSMEEFLSLLDEAP